MSDYQPQRDPSEPDEVARLLSSALDGEQPREAFVSELANRLDREFLAVVAGAEPRDRRHERNGHTGGAKRRPTVAADELVSGASQTKAVVVTGTPVRRRRRWFAGFALAVALLLAVTISNLQPGYSFASMVAAMKSQPWVQTVAEPGGAGRVSGWVSWVHGVVARRSDKEVVFDNLTDGVRNRYRVDQRVVYRQPLEGETRPSPEQALLNFVLYGDPPQTDALALNADWSDNGTVEVVRQTARKVRNDGGKWIELDVALRVGNRPDVRNVQFVLDPKTSLPKSARVSAQDGRGVLECRLSYPTEGPRDVHAAALGVPVDVPVEDLVVMRTEADDEAAKTAVLMTDGEVEVAPAPADPGIAEQVNVIESTVPQEEEEIVEDDGPRAAPTDTQVAVDEEDEEDEPAPPVASDEEMALRVDQLLAACWQQHGIRPAELASDPEYLRRVYLDLTGRIPDFGEVRDFMNDPRADRRVHLLDDLLDRYDHATHLAAVWRRILLPDGVDLTRYGGPIEFERWLADRFRENVPYDRIVRELLLAEGRVTEPGPLMFYTALRMQPELLAGRTSRAFLGTRIECAQCHDHKFDDRWKQKDFWGYAAFFARISRPEGKMEAVSTVMRVQDSPRGEVTLPESDKVIPPRFPLGDESLDADGAPARRKRLADWLTRHNNQYFARATVNRVWEHLFGKGLVDPVDDMGPDNPAVCPEVLDELATYFADSGYDLRKLIRTLVLSDAYQLSSSTDEDDPSRLIYFAQMNVKTFTAEQLFDCIAVATRLQSPVMGEGNDNSVERFNNASRQEFLEQFRAAPGQATEYQAGIPQALTLMNGGLIQSGTDMAQSGMLKIVEAPFQTDKQRVDMLFMATLSRPPDEVEQTAMLKHVAAAAGRAARQEAFGDILWVLLNSAEFTLNH